MLILCGIILLSVSTFVIGYALYRLGIDIKEGNRLRRQLAEIKERRNQRGG